MEVTLWFGGVLTGFLYNTLPMYMINLIIIYDIYHIFSMKNHESLRKLRVGMKIYVQLAVIGSR